MVRIHVTTLAVSADDVGSRRALAEAWPGHAPRRASAAAPADLQWPQRACSRQFQLEAARMSDRRRLEARSPHEIMTRTQQLWLLEKERNRDGAQQRPQITLVLLRSRSAAARDATTKSLNW